MDKFIGGTIDPLEELENNTVSGEDKLLNFISKYNFNIIIEPFFSPHIHNKEHTKFKAYIKNLFLKVNNKFEAEYGLGNTVEEACVDFLARLQLTDNIMHIKDNVPYQVHIQEGE